MYAILRAIFRYFHLFHENCYIHCPSKNWIIRKKFAIERVTKFGASFQLFFIKFGASFQLFYSKFGATFILFSAKFRGTFLTVRKYQSARSTNLLPHGQLFHCHVVNKFIVISAQTCRYAPWDRNSCSSHPKLASGWIRWSQNGCFCRTHQDPQVKFIELDQSHVQLVRNGHAVITGMSITRPEYHVWFEISGVGEWPGNRQKRYLSHLFLRLIPFDLLPNC